jgi:hypothetical protein
MALALGAGSVALGQPSQLWENYGIYQIPPPQDNIDATTVINHAGATFNFSGDILFNTYDTLNFTNQGLLVGDPGFDFETIPTGTGMATMAANFVNQASGTSTNNGTINCSGAFAFVISPQLPLGNLTGNSKLVARATNIVSSGSINMDASSLIQFIGKNIDISRGSLTMNNPTLGLRFFSAGQLDGYWGVGRASNPFVAGSLAPVLFPVNLTAGISQFHRVTTRNYVFLFQQLALNNPVAYLNDSGVIASNRTVQSVLIMNTNAAFVNSVFFDPFELAVQWQWSQTNWPNGTVTTNNYMWVADDFGEVTNLQVGIDGFAGVKPTYMPVTYFWGFGAPFSTFGAASPTVLPFDIFGTGFVTNEYAAYQAIFTAGTELPTDVAGGNATNLAGRIEISADNTLNLNQTRISSLNYLLLKSTNHFLGSSRAVIGAPTTDMYLRTTNATLAVTNLIAPYLNHLQGICDLYSARWTNVTTDPINGTVTNRYHVLLVDSEISPVTTPIVQTVQLTVTNNTGAQNNLQISDILNITSNLTVSADSLTLTTNPLDHFTHSGQITLLNPDILWPSSTPGLKYLTNYGGITTFNSVYFGGSHTQPPYNTNLVNIPYGALVNHGGITNQSSLVWASDFENYGPWNCGQGSFILQQATNCVMTNSVLLAGGDVSLASSSLFLSNTLILSSSSLTLAPTNVLDDGSALTGSADYITNKNFWSFGGSINLLSLAPRASLLGTTITNFAPDFASVNSVWAGTDRGASPGGFQNNAALGHLILDGNTNCAFEFDAAGPTNALYVDLLDLRNFVARNVDNHGNFMSITCAPNMTVYFGQALANNVSIAEKLPLVNGGRFIWVSNYNTGFFSSTNLVYPDGSTNRLNTALVTSCDIDSNGNGIPNCMDPAPIPILTPVTLALSVGLTNSPALAATVTWTAFPYTTNYLYSSTEPNSTNWQLVTNFVYSGPFPGRVTVPDLIKTNVPKFYKVRAGMP